MPCRWLCLQTLFSQVNTFAFQFERYRTSTDQKERIAEEIKRNLELEREEVGKRSCASSVIRYYRLSVHIRGRLLWRVRSVRD